MAIVSAKMGRLMQHNDKMSPSPLPPFYCCQFYTLAVVAALIILHSDGYHGKEGLAGNHALSPGRRVKRSGFSSFWDKKNGLATVRQHRAPGPCSLGLTQDFSSIFLLKVIVARKIFSISKSNLPTSTSIIIVKNKYIEFFQ